MNIVGFESILPGCRRQRRHLRLLILFGALLLLSTVVFLAAQSGTRRTYQLSHQALAPMAPGGFKVCSYTVLRSERRQVRNLELCVGQQLFIVSVDSQELW